MKDASDAIFMVLFGLGIAFTVIVGAVIGIKMMLSSAVEKAKWKEALIPYIGVCIIIFGASGIWLLCVKLLSSI